MNVRHQFMRQEELRSFSVDVAEIRALVDQLKKSFGEQQPTERYDIDLPGQNLTAGSIDEITQTVGFPDRFSELMFWLTGTGPGNATRRLIFRTTPGVVFCRAEADDEAWCAGVLDIAQAFSRRHAVWWWPLRTSVGLVALIFCPSILVIGLVAVQVRIRNGGPLLWGVTAVSVLLAMSVCWRANRFFSCATIMVRRKEAWMRRYATEINVVAAVIAAIAAVLALFAGGRAT